MTKITFINKHPSSGNISRSTPEERRRINERNREHRNAGRSRRSQDSRTELKASSASVEEDLIASSDALAVAPIKGRANKPLTKNPGGRFDPFDSASVPLNSDVMRLLRFYKDAYYARIWGNVAFLLEGKVESLDINRCGPEGVILECMQNKARMYSLLADAACHLAHDLKSDSDIKPLTLIQRGVISLRQELQEKHNQLDSEVLLNAIHLYLAARAYQQGETARLHLNGARSILRQMRSQNVTINRPLAGMITFIDIDVASELLRPMSQDHLKYKCPRSALKYEEIEAMPEGQRP